MSTTITISDEIARSLERLPVNGFLSTEDKLRSLLLSEYHRRLARYRLTDTTLTRKYGMSFSEFEEDRVTEREGYSWEVEQDAISWDQATDGIATMERQIARLKADMA